MKKILLALMMISSFAFSADPIYWQPVGMVPTSLNTPLVTGTCYYDSLNDKYIVINGLIETTSSYRIGADILATSGTKFFNGTRLWIVTNVGTVLYQSTYTSTQSYYAYNAYYPSQKYRAPECNNVNLTPTCTSSQELINNVCVEKCPSGQERLDGVCVNSCNQMIGEFRKSDGTCQDCSPYTNFSSRSFCACDSQGSTYTPQALVTTTQTNGNYTYEKTNITCDSGLRIAIYTNPVNINPQDYNATLNTNGSVTPVDANSTVTPTDPNSTYTPPVQTNHDIVEAIKLNNDVSKEIKGEIGKVATDVKAMNEHLAKQGTTFNEVLASIKANGEENKKSNQLLGDVNTGLTQFKNKFGQWVDDTRNDSANEVAAVNGTTNAVNNQGKNITDKLDEVIKAIKEDGNGTSPTDNNNTGKEIDLNETNKKLDTLHDDNNKTHSILDKIAGFLDSNATVDINRTGFSFGYSDMLPEGGLAWFATNALKPTFNISSNNCYCQTAEFSVAGRTFIFPPQSALDIIPFGLISNIFMAFIYVLGLKSFLRN